MAGAGWGDSRIFQMAAAGGIEGVVGEGFEVEEDEGIFDFCADAISSLPNGLGQGGKLLNARVLN